MTEGAPHEDNIKAGRVTHFHLPSDVRKQWYAVAFSEDVPSPKPGAVGSKAPSPLALSLLGDPVVLWRDKFGTVHCIADKCPHRSAPLSLGSIHGDTGAIECIYHGWQIDGASGCVTHIPAILPGKEIPTSAKCQTYAVVEQDGVVWTFAGDPEEAKAAALPMRDVMDDGQPLAEAKGFVSQHLCVDLPIDHSLMLENLLDPAHIPFAHEGTIGSRKRIESLEMKLTKTDKGIKGCVKEGYFFAFEAPCNIILHAPPVPGKMDMYQYIACTPTCPGQMRMVYRAYRNFGTWIERVAPLRRIFLHFSTKIIFQDYRLLLGQQQRLRERALPWNTSIQVDSLPLLYRRYWQRTFAKLSADGPWWRGWDGSMDVEDLDRLGAWSRDFDCGGCAVPRTPHHPQNPLEVPGTPGTPLRPSLPSSSLRQTGLLILAAFGGAAVAMALSQ